MTVHLEDLSPLEIALLGVLSLGLPPARAAGDDTFRVDHCTAVVHGLQAEGDGRRFLAPDGISVTPEFAGWLRSCIEGLTGRGILAEPPPGMPAAPGGYEVGLLIDLANPDAHPAVLDRWLAQECMEQLFRQVAIYPFLMGQYARSGEFWRRAREEGYAR